MLPFPEPKFKPCGNDGEIAQDVAFPPVFVGEIVVTALLLSISTGV